TIIGGVEAIKDRRVARREERLVRQLHVELRLSGEAGFADRVTDQRQFRGITAQRRVEFQPDLAAGEAVARQYDGTVILTRSVQAAQAGIVDDVGRHQYVGIPAQLDAVRTHRVDRV